MVEISAGGTWWIGPRVSRRHCLGYLPLIPKHLGLALLRIFFFPWTSIFPLEIQTYPRLYPQVSVFMDPDSAAIRTSQTQSEVTSGLHRRLTAASGRSSEAPPNSRFNYPQNSVFPECAHVCSGTDPPGISATLFSAIPSLPLASAVGVHAFSFNFLTFSRLLSKLWQQLRPLQQMWQ